VCYSDIELLKNIKFIKKFINFTTPEVYGSNKNWIKENSYFDPSTPYAVSRAALDMHLKILFKEKKFPVIFTRAANIYGPGQQIYRLIPKLIYCALTNTVFKMQGNGRSFRSFVYIDDVSQALIKILSKGKLGKTYHISDKKIYSIKKISKIVEKVLKIKIKIKHINERIGKDIYYKLDSSFANKSLNWKSKVSIEKGINLTYNWLKNNFKKIKKKHLIYIHKK
jgi:dTDP-glucose 4,6-dehydratase